MLTFNHLLEAARIPLERTRLARHKDQRSTAKVEPYTLWQRGDGSFERYQSVQKNVVWKPGDYVAACVVVPLTGETLFVGLYFVTGQDVVTDPDRTCPVSGRLVLGSHLYSMEKVESFASYEGRVIVDWGSGFRNWVHRAANQAKPLLEVRQQRHELPWPGFPRFHWSVRRLDDLPRPWIPHLAHAFGVYLLVSRQEGKLYVGSALGNEGFLQRWRSYQANGHGGNRDLKQVAGHDYEVSVLEVAASNATEKEVLAQESLWKQKLLTREFGLNGN
ncbi:GIY-YIG nuclease family protein [Frateuria sp. GZRR33]|uniref:GIY-YIG nuclease family protein n=1 Tax=Frateuria sp. GZRR33 TaxID=3351535 RepID=UPI003EDCA764